MSIFNDIRQRELLYRPIAQRRNIVGSRYLIERYERQHLLTGHTGCVNTVLFSEDGCWIYTGSDDTHVNIYDTETGRMHHRFQTVHTNNIFYAKDMPNSEMRMVLTCAADGRVALTNMETMNAKKLYRHRGRAHRIGLVPNNSDQFYSCGEDGVCCLFDLRDGGRSLFRNRSCSIGSAGSYRCGGQGNNEGMGDFNEENWAFEAGPEMICTPVLKAHFLNNRERKCSIYTVGVNPNKPHLVALGGSSSNVMLFDSRKMAKPVGYFCPETKDIMSAHVTGLKWDHAGDMLLASYNDDDVYSFQTNYHLLDTRRLTIPAKKRESVESPSTQSNYPPPPPELFTTPDRKSDGAELTDNTDRGFYRQYSGHRNSNTVKQVSYLGTRSEFVVSGSDCGHLFIWDTHTAELVQILDADRTGAINCLAAHQALPILATSGLESNAKVWAPIGDHQPLGDPGSDKKQRAEEISARNLQREQSYGYSRNLLSLLMTLLARDEDVAMGVGGFDIPDGEDDDEDDDVEEDDEEEEIDDGYSSDNSGGDDDAADTLHDEHFDIPSRHAVVQQVEECAQCISNGEGVEPNNVALTSIVDGSSDVPAHTTSSSPADTSPPDGFSESYRRRVRQAAGETNATPVRVRTNDTTSSSTSGSQSAASVARRELRLMQLSRLIPALLGRRSRSARSTSDSEDEYDPEEAEDVAPDDEDAYYERSYTTRISSRDAGEEST